MAKDFLPYSIDQQLLLPPDMRDWLSERHLALFVHDLVDQLDLRAIYAAYESADDRGRRGYRTPITTVSRTFASGSARDEFRLIALTHNLQP